MDVLWAAGRALACSPPQTGSVLTRPQFPCQHRPVLRGDWTCLLPAPTAAGEGPTPWGDVARHVSCRGGWQDRRRDEDGRVGWMRRLAWPPGPTDRKGTQRGTGVGPTEAPASLRPRGGRMWATRRAPQTPHLRPPRPVDRHCTPSLTDGSPQGCPPQTRPHPRQTPSTRPLGLLSPNATRPGWPIFPVWLLQAQLEPLLWLDPGSLCPTQGQSPACLRAGGQAASSPTSCPPVRAPGPAHPVPGDSAWVRGLRGLSRARSWPLAMGAGTGRPS